MQKTHHTMGKKSTVRARKESEVEDHLQLWKLTRLHKDGSWVSDDTKEKWELACSMLARENLTPEDGNIDANETVFAAVMGPKHPGRVRGRGFGVSPNRFFPKSTYCVGSSSSSKPSDSQLGRHIQLQEIMDVMQTDIRELKNIILAQNCGVGESTSSAPPPDDDDEDDDGNEEQEADDLDD